MAQWAAIIGTKGIGKSSTSLELARLLRNRHVRVGGFVQQGYLDDLERKCYNLHRLDSAHVVPLARPMTVQQATEPDDQVSVCSLAFDQQAFALARTWIEQDLRTCPVIIIDEVSKLEAIGQGHHDAIVKALEGPPNTVVVLSIRAGPGRCSTSS